MVDLDSARKDLRLVRGQVMPRLRLLLLSWVPLSAVVCAVALTTAAPALPVASMPIAEAASNGMTFASIAMGACISALVLSLGLPGTERLRRWSRMKGKTANKSALSDLIFVLVWAALSQIALIAVCVLAIAFGSELPLAPPSWPPSHAIGLGIGLSLFFYALFELVVVIQTLSQMGVMIIAEEQLTDTNIEARH